MDRHICWGRTHWSRVSQTQLDVTNIVDCFDFSVTIVDGLRRNDLWLLASQPIYGKAVPFACQPAMMRLHGTVPQYDVAVITGSEKVLVRLQRHGCAAMQSRVDTESRFGALVLMLPRFAR